METTEIKTRVQNWLRGLTETECREALLREPRCENNAAKIAVMEDWIAQHKKRRSVT